VYFSSTFITRDFLVTGISHLKVSSTVLFVPYILVVILIPDTIPLYEIPKLTV
jgi:hypothetical protein